VASGTDLPSFLSSRGIGHSSLGSGLVVPPTGVWNLLEDDRFFAGFDELWLFEKSPSEPLHAQIVITSEGPIGARDISGLGIWMRRTGCTLGVGDGHGLNYATLSLAVAKEVRSAAQ
jgi:hypothetical protein